MKRILEAVTWYACALIGGSLLCLAHGENPEVRL